LQVEVALLLSLSHSLEIYAFLVVVSGFGHFQISFNLPKFLTWSFPRESALKSFLQMSSHTSFPPIVFCPYSDCFILNDSLRYVFSPGILCFYQFMTGYWMLYWMQSPLIRSLRNLAISNTRNYSEDTWPFIPNITVHIGSSADGRSCCFSNWSRGLHCIPWSEPCARVCVYVRSCQFYNHVVFLCEIIRASCVRLKWTIDFYEKNSFCT